MKQLTEINQDSIGELRLKDPYLASKSIESRIKWLKTARKSDRIQAYRWSGRKERFFCKRFGICPTCQIRQAEPNRVYCIICLKRMRKQGKKEYKRKHLNSRTVYNK